VKNKPHLYCNVCQTPNKASRVNYVTALSCHDPAQSLHHTTAPPHCFNTNIHQLQSGHSPAVQLICWSLDREILKCTVESHSHGHLTDTLNVQQAQILHQP